MRDALAEITRAVRAGNYDLVRAIVEGLHAGPNNLAMDRAWW
jgi:hypothetical protein